MKETKLITIIKAISYLCLIAFVVLQFTMNFKVSGRLINIFFLGWLVSSLPSLLQQKKRYYTLILFLLLVTLFISINWGLKQGFIKSYDILLAISPIIMYDTLKYAKREYVVILVNIFSFVYIIDIFKSYFITQITAGSGLRYLRDMDIYFSNAFDLTYALCIIIPSLIYFLVNRNIIAINKKTITLVFIAVLVISSFILIFKSFFMIAIIMSVLGVPLGFYYGKKKWKKKFLISVVIILVAFMASYNFLQFHVERSENASEGLGNKLTELKDILSNKSSNATDFSSRQDLMYNSWKTFFSNPLIGVFTEDLSFEGVYKLGVGQHSEWLDLLALYGLISLALFAFLFTSIKQIGKEIGNYLFIIPYIAIGLFNPEFFFIQNFTAFFYVPLLYKFLFMKQQQ